MLAGRKLFLNSEINIQVLAMRLSQVLLATLETSPDKSLRLRERFGGIGERPVSK